MTIRFDPEESEVRAMRMSGVVEMLVLATALTACQYPFACQVESRSANYEGRLGELVPPDSSLDPRDSGRVFVGLLEDSGVYPQQSLNVSVNVWGFMSTVSALHIHAGTPGNPGALLWSTNQGLLIRDSTWNTGSILFGGPGQWSDLWTKLADGQAYFEVHSSTGDSASAVLGQTSFNGFHPACID
jgi:hypothetical protein